MTPRERLSGELSINTGVLFIPGCAPSCADETRRGCWESGQALAAASCLSSPAYHCEQSDAAGRCCLPAAATSSAAPQGRGCTWQINHGQRLWHMQYTPNRLDVPADRQVIDAAPVKRRSWLAGNAWRWRAPEDEAQKPRGSCRRTVDLVQSLATPLHDIHQGTENRHFVLCNHL